MDLVIEGVSKAYGERFVLDDLDLRVVPGETVAIVGPSGSGKSTLLNIVGSLDTPTSGTVKLGDFVVASMGAPASKGGRAYPRANDEEPETRAPLGGRAYPRANDEDPAGAHPLPASPVKGEGCGASDLSMYRAKMVGFVFQEHLLLPQLTAAENVLLPTLALPERVPHSRALELLEAVGVSQRADAYPAQMSGGERQRVAVARAMINRPALLLCDEPTGNLDFETGASVVELLLALARDGVAVLMATHNLDHAAKLARCAHLAGGRLEE